MDYRDLPYDAEIEYLESTERQYIKTGIIPTSEFSYEVIAEILGNYEWAPAGTWDGWVNNMFGVDLKFSVNGSILNCWGDTFTENKVRPINTWLKISQKNGEQKISRLFDGYVYLNGNLNKTFQCSGDIYIFSLNQGNKSVCANKGRISSVIIRNNNNTLFDAIPVRVGNVGYMYDRVSGQLFGNSGTGSFVLGPDVAPGRYANEIAFLESTGSQYIDNVYTDNASANEVIFDFQVNGTGDIIGNKGGSSDYYANGTKIVGISSGTGAFAYYKPTSNRVLLQLNSGENIRTNIVTTFSKTTSTFTIEADGETLSGAYSGIAGNKPYTMLVRDSGLTVGYFVGKIYSGKIYEDGVLVRDFIPVEYNNIGYLYDKVSGEFFANQGTGKFVLGHRAPRFDGKACARSYTRRATLMGRKPYDAEIEYLEIPKSTNAPTKRAYINTGYIETPGFGFHVEAYGNGNFVGGVNFAVIGTDNSLYTASDWTILTKASLGNNFGLKSAPGNYKIKFVWELIQNNNTATFRVKRDNSETSGTIAVNDFTEKKLPILIGYGMTNSVTQKKTSGGFYLYKVVFYEYQTIVKDFVPVRVGNVGYMYDKVSGKLFGNAGTGNFILGPDKH